MLEKSERPYAPVPECVNKDNIRTSLLPNPSNKGFTKGDHEETEANKLHHTTTPPHHPPPKKSTDMVLDILLMVPQDLLTIRQFGF